ncbi:MAG: hypothetical protein UT21_C0006G0014 [Candidatus Woesebacteria bacterium GW2011_GWA1_39_11b]|nr:MAG: hypothetical protein UT21_C0006G0014 [Candidatus Woesebacteria bacterium GW2011_GWA1_39_11b]
MTPHPIPKYKVKKTIVFHNKGTFEAFYAAKDWMVENNYSCGSSCAFAPVGLIEGDYDIAKWKNMTKSEINTLDGVMTGDLREGPVTITIFDK